MIEVTFEKSEQYTDKRLEVYANGVNVGDLMELPANQDILAWNPDPFNAHNASFMFRNADTFLQVVDHLKEYIHENGYRYLTVWTYNDGYGTLISKELLEEAGFHHLPDTNPACLYLS